MQIQVTILQLKQLLNLFPMYDGARDPAPVTGRKCGNQGRLDRPPTGGGLLVQRKP